MEAQAINRRLAAILSADVKGYSRLMGEDEEAIAAWKQSPALNPHWLVPRIALAGTYSLVGREEEARAEAAEVLKRNPHFSVEVLKQRSPDPDSARSEQFFAALRKAGLQ